MGLGVEPVLRTVLDSKAALNVFAVVGCHATSSVNAVDLLVSPRAGGSGAQLQPWHTAERVLSLARSCGCRALSIDLGLDTSVVGFRRLEHEQGNTGSGELVVARQALFGFW